MDAAVADVHDILEDAVMERTVWAAMKARSTRCSRRAEPDAELAETFFNSVTRRVFSTVGVDPAIEYLDLTAAVQAGRAGPEHLRQPPVRGRRAPTWCGGSCCECLVGALRPAGPRRRRWWPS